MVWGAGEGGVWPGGSIALDHVLLFPQAPTRVFTKPAPAALLGGPAWLSFSKPVSLGGLPPHHSSWVLMSAAGEAVSQHSCRLCSAPTQERALPGMASSDPTPMGRQGKRSSGRPWPGSWSRCATLGGPRLQLGIGEAWTWKSGGPFKGHLVQSHGEKREVL